MVGVGGHTEDDEGPVGSVQFFEGPDKKRYEEICRIQLLAPSGWACAGRRYGGRHSQCRATRRRQPGCTRRSRRARCRCLSIVRWYSRGTRWQCRGANNELDAHSCANTVAMFFVHEEAKAGAARSKLPHALKSYGRLSLSPSPCMILLSHLPPFTVCVLSSAARG